MVSAVSRKLCYIGLGSNLGSSTETLESAINALQAISGLEGLQLSSFYRSKPHGPQDQPDYINAVAGFTTDLEPLALLDQLQTIENVHGRTRNGHQWTARTLDLDILLYGHHEINSDRLTVPHSWMTRREFVVLPLLEIAPDLRLPDGVLLKSYLDQLPIENLIKIESRL